MHWSTALCLYKATFAIAFCCISCSYCGPYSPGLTHWDLNIMPDSWLAISPNAFFESIFLYSSSNSTAVCPWASTKQYIGTGLGPRWAPKRMITKITETYFPHSASVSLPIFFVVISTSFICHAHAFETTEEPPPPPPPLPPYTDTCTVAYLLQIGWLLARNM